MPITPHFSLSQTEATVVVEICVPHVRVSVQSVEVVLDGSVLHFSSPPYLLVLNFPARLVEATNECATYDPSRGTITLRLQKEEAAIWKDLDMMGSLMTPKQQPRGRPGNVSIVSSTVKNESEDSSDKNEEDGMALVSNLPDLQNALRPHYGFLNMFVGVFTDLARDGLAAEMLELPFPDETPPESRRRMRLQTEQTKFDEDRYLGDLHVQEDYIYKVAMSMVPHWTEEQKTKSSVDDVTRQMSQLTTTTTENESNREGLSSNCYFTQEETAQLASIPYPLLPSNITPIQERSLFMGLLDILFAYVYDHVTTDGEPTVESSWTICILSCTLSWLEEYRNETHTIETVVANCIRRALVYPYLRNYELALHSWDQVACIVQNGRRCVIRSLLQIRSILDKSECHYLGNRLYIDPYLAWMQRNVTDKSLAMIQSDLNAVLRNVHQNKCLGKETMGLNLIQLELMAEHEYVNDSDSSGDNESEGINEEYDSSDSSDADDTDEDDSSDEEGETHSDLDAENKGETRPALIPSQVRNSNQESAANLPTSGREEKLVSKELIDSELPTTSAAQTILDTLCNPMTKGIIIESGIAPSDSQGAKEALSQRPLIEEIP